MSTTSLNALAHQVTIPVNLNDSEACRKISAEIKETIEKISVEERLRVPRTVNQLKKLSVKEIEALFASAYAGPIPQPFIPEGFTALEVAELKYYDEFSIALSAMETIYSGFIPFQLDGRPELKEKILFSLIKAISKPAIFVEIGRCYAEGIGVRKNPRIAFAWFEMAAKAGNPDAYYEVAIGELEAVLLARTSDNNNSLEAFLRAANYGSGNAQYQLGLYHEARHALNNNADDLKKSNEYFSMAANHGHSMSQYKLAENLFPTNPNLATDYLMKAAKQGHALAHFGLTGTYMSGNDRTPKSSKASLIHCLLAYDENYTNEYLGNPNLIREHYRSLICNIQLTLSLDPVTILNHPVALQRNTIYDRKSISEWIAIHGTCPLTRVDLTKYCEYGANFKKPNWRLEKYSQLPKQIIFVIKVRMALDALSEEDEDMVKDILDFPTDIDALKARLTPELFIELSNSELGHLAGFNETYFVRFPPRMKKMFALERQKFVNSQMFIASQTFHGMMPSSLLEIVADSLGATLLQSSFDSLEGAAIASSLISASAPSVLAKSLLKAEPENTKASGVSDASIFPALAANASLSPGLSGAGPNASLENSPLEAAKSAQAVILASLSSTSTVPQLTTDVKSIGESRTIENERLRLPGPTQQNAAAVDVCSKVAVSPKQYFQQFLEKRDSTRPALVLTMYEMQMRARELARHTAADKRTPEANKNNPK
jgi:TPR repeat protein